MNLVTDFVQGAGRQGQALSTTRPGYSMRTAPSSDAEASSIFSAIDLVAARLLGVARILDQIEKREQNLGRVLDAHRSLPTPSVSATKGRGMA